LLLARHAQRVIATDINPRALWLTRLNAALNDVTNIECRDGSFFEPVEGERFDVIACNPPFVISPDNDFVFRDSGLGGDAVSRLLMTEAGNYLNEGGFATVLVNWGIAETEAWDAPGRRWLESQPLDALFVGYGTNTPLPYAATWNGRLLALDPPAYAAALDRWLAYFDALGFSKIGQVGAVLRRREALNWIAAYEAETGPSGSASEQIERIFRAQDYLQQATTPFARERFASVAGQYLDERMRLTDGEYRFEKAFLRLDHGLGLACEVEGRMLPLLFNLDTGDLRRATFLLSTLSEAPPADLLRDAEALIRRLFERGLVERVTTENQAG
jgi:methylase of polypeptide subunit release factors